MLTSRCTLCFTLLLATLLGANVIAQDSSGRRPVHSNERTARAAWTPTRSSNSHTSTRPSSPSKKSSSQTQARPASQRPVATSRTRPRVKQVDHSIVEGGEIVPMQQSLDGQVMLEPMHGGGYVEGGSCGCDSAGCDGGCDTMGCSTGCNSCGGGGCDSCCGEMCGRDSWRPCMTLCVPQDGWVSYEYLGWWQKGMSLPPLITTSTSSTIPQNQAGVLGQATTRTLYGGNDVLQDMFNGGRLRFGFWLDQCHQWGIGAEYLFIGREDENFSATSGGNPILARPFFNTSTNLEDSELIAFPGVVSGTGSVAAYSELQGWGVHVRHLRQCDQGCTPGILTGCSNEYCSRTECMLGYRNLQLNEGIAIREDLVGINPANNFQILDQFDTRNQFSGLDVGWMYRRTRGFWTFDTLMRLGIGNTRQTVTINGNTRIDNGAVQQGGLLAQTSNIGTFKQDQFSVIPEINLNLGYQLTDNIRLIAGYSALYWSNVVRPGEHISRDLNPGLLPPPTVPLVGAARPVFKWDTVDYWAQGMNFGAEYRW